MDNLNDALSDIEGLSTTNDTLSPPWISSNSLSSSNGTPGMTHVLPIGKLFLLKNKQHPRNSSSKLALLVPTEIYVNFGISAYLRCWQRNWCRKRPSSRNALCRRPAGSRCMTRQCPEWRWWSLRTRRRCRSSPWNRLPTWCSACAKRCNDRDFHSRFAVTH